MSVPVVLGWQRRKSAAAAGVRLLVASSVSVAVLHLPAQPSPQSAALRSRGGEGYSCVRRVRLVVLRHVVVAPAALVVSWSLLPHAGTSALNTGPSPQNSATARDKGSRRPVLAAAEPTTGWAALAGSVSSSSSSSSPLHRLLLLRTVPAVAARRWSCYVAWEPAVVAVAPAVSWTSPCRRHNARRCMAVPADGWCQLRMTREPGRGGADAHGVPHTHRERRRVRVVCGVLRLVSSVSTWRVSPPLPRPHAPPPPPRERLATAARRWREGGSAVRRPRQLLCVAVAMSTSTAGLVLGLRVLAVLDGARLGAGVV